MDKIVMKELQAKLTEDLKQWQRTEGAAVQFGEKLASSTENPVIKNVAEIIRSDSQRHAAIQQLIIDSFEKSAISLSPDDLAKVWPAIENHIKSEQDMVARVREALGLLKGRGLVVQQYLLEYLLLDEEKHDALLAKLEGVKKGMYPYG